MAKRKFLGEMLIDSGIITRDDLQHALEYQKANGVRLGKALIDMGYVTQEAINETLGKQMGIPYVNLDTYVIDRKVMDGIPENLARKYKIFPLFLIGSTLTIAMADPLNVHAIDEVRQRSGYDIDAAIATEQQIENAVDLYYGVSGSFDTIVDEIIDSDLKDTDEAAAQSEEAPIIRLVNVIIHQAIHENASDIHIEPDETKLRIRYRIDGILNEAKSPPKRLQAALISRIKVMSQLDIAENRVPQDGRLKMTVDDREVEFRVSTFPTIYGENIVIRILDQSKTILNLKDLGFPGTMLERYMEMLQAPYGIILVTGPTGSGKTTTLYASLNAVNSIEKNIITIEDPVEYRLSLIRQTQINPRAGLTFAAGLRSILRQDPDVVMVGEMRDFETAEIAFQAALTGHLVFSTLHTNDAAGALARLLHFGIEPFLVASSTVGVIAQRLVRRLCQSCKAPYKPSDEEIITCGLQQSEDITFYKPRGCKSCRNTGYRGRTGLYEVLKVDDAMRNLILKHASVSEIRDHARRNQSMELLREAGIKKVVQGITTLDEVNRLTFVEEM